MVVYNLPADTRLRARQLHMAARALPALSSELRIGIALRNEATLNEISPYGAHVDADCWIGMWNLARNTARAIARSIA